MTQLFLTSTISKTAVSVAQKLNLSQKNKLVFIDTAAEPKEGDKQWLKDDRQSLVEAGFQVIDYTITGKTKEQLKSDLEKFDQLYLSGGNTSYLLQQSIKSGFIDLVRDLIINQGKTYIGSSAGSIIAGPKLPEYLIELDDPGQTNLIEHPAYSFVNFTILPHWGSPSFKKRYLEGRLEIAYQEDQVPLLLLTDNQYVHIQDDILKIIDLNLETK